MCKGLLNRRRIVAVGAQSPEERGRWQSATIRAPRCLLLFARADSRWRRGEESVYESSTAASVSVVLVHGGFVDGSGWQGVYNILQQHGYRVRIVQNPTISFDDDRRRH